MDSNSTKETIISFSSFVAPDIDILLPFLHCCIIISPIRLNAAMQKGSKISISGATNEENEMIVSFVEFESME